MKKLFFVAMISVIFVGCELADIEEDVEVIDEVAPVETEEVVAKAPEKVLPELLETLYVTTEGSSKIVFTTYDLKGSDELTFTNDIYPILGFEDPILENCNGVTGRANLKVKDLIKIEDTNNYTAELVEALEVIEPICQEPTNGTLDINFLGFKFDYPEIATFSVVPYSEDWPQFRINISNKEDDRNGTLSNIRLNIERKDFMEVMEKNGTAHNIPIINPCEYDPPWERVHGCIKHKNYTEYFIETSRGALGLHKRYIFERPEHDWHLIELDVGLLYTNDTNDDTDSQWQLTKDFENDIFTPEQQARIDYADEIIKSVKLY